MATAVALDDRRAPRLSSFLRAKRSGAAPSQSELLLGRRAALAAGLALLDDAQVGGDAPGASERLSWKTFGDGSSTGSTRRKFAEFLSLCGTMAGDEEQSVGERLETLAQQLYDGFNSEQGLRKVDVEIMLNSRVKKDVVQQARQLAQELAEWKRANPSAGASSRRRGQADAALELLERPYAVEGDPIASRERALETEASDLDARLASDAPSREETAPDAFAAATTPSQGDEWSWLVEQCTLHTLKMDHALMSASELASSVVQLLGSGSGDDALQGELLDLLGMSEGTFELMAQLIERRQALARAGPSQGSSSGGTPSGASASLRSEAPQFLPASRGQGGLARGAVVDSAAPGERGAARVALPNMRPGARPAGTAEEQVVYKRLTGPGTDGDGDESKSRYIRVHVPAKRAPGAATRYRVPISAFGSLAQMAFRGIESLNQLQSAVFETAYTSNTNLLVCAPTGAGKTNVAMTCVVREIERHAEDVSQVKIIYVAPMKALAQEVVDKFGQRLKPLGVRVRELTGDMQLTRNEIERTQVIVTTPEKWDVITRKSGDGTLVEAVGLLIIDEVHLVGEDRGPVIESLIARTLRLVEQKQKMVRIVGLSATLPNYRDVARFLRVHENQGLFFFDNSYRPVPLEQTFIGVIEKNLHKRLALLNDLAFENAAQSVRKGDQVMIFVHSRKDTSKTARGILEAARASGNEGVFCDLGMAVNKKARTLFESDVAKSRNADLRELFEGGIGIHHAGMTRPDRSLTEKMFARGAISVLCCTATLAWGVNLPAHTVIIKGTQVYVAEKGGLVELNMQDVFQCFGRAGRPQYDTSGEAVLITEQSQLNRYLSMLNHALPLESHLDKRLPDALNAEIVSGTVTNLAEAVEWLSYTFLHIRMIMNPMRYGISHKEKMEDPTLLRQRAQLIVNAARELDRAKMARFALASRGGAAYNPHLSASMPDMQAPFGVTDLGRVASHYYIGHGTIEEFNAKLKPDMDDANVLNLLCHASEFDQLKVREEEIMELGKLRKKGCPLAVLAAPDGPQGKACILLQSYISRSYVQAFTLSSDMMYISQNMGRVARAVFEVCLKKRWSSMAEKMLAICTALDRRCWWPPLQHPLRQLAPDLLQLDIVAKLEERGDAAHIEMLAEMEAAEIGGLVRHAKMGPKILKATRRIPYLSIEAHLQPLSRSILRVTLDIFPDFEWSDRHHGGAQNFWIWVDDQNSEWIYHVERFTLRKADWKAARRGDSGQEAATGDEEAAAAPARRMHPALVSAALEANSCTRREFTIPIFEPLPPQYFLRVFSDAWLGSEAVVPLTLDRLVLPKQVKQHTDLLELTPLPRSALRNPVFESLYEHKFTHFNPIQTQAFHVLYHTDHPVLLGAPTGSGKTISSELALLRMFNEHPDGKAVYIAPLKALVSERVREWGKTLQPRLGKRIVEFTGDVTPNPGVLARADVLITTPEKWDGASRMWQRRDYVQKVRLVIIDEIHLLGEERGAVLEVLVTRMRYIAGTSGNPVRIVGLSTALANAHDLGNWLGIKDGVGLYNFRPAVRPVPLEAHIHGFPGKHYCPRMATMNKPTYQAILTHSPTKPVLVFVASRRQTRLTALDLIALCAGSENPRRFLHMPFHDMEALLQASVKDDTLMHTLAFGIGIHHAGLDSRDRELVEDLFVNGKIQVLVCTSTLAWGVNFPAHLVVIKGTEYFDAKTKRYQPFPVTDVLQMMGRAGRPQFDQTGVAMIFVEESLKDFYKKFLYEPFPVESHLPEFLHNHLNAEIAAGSVASEREALDYLSWTYFFRRLPMNPSYYGLEGNDPDAVALFLIELVRQVLLDLKAAGCVTLGSGGLLRDAAGAKSSKGWHNDDSVTQKSGAKALETKMDNIQVHPTQVGKICSFYYLNYRSMQHFLAFFAGRGAGYQAGGRERQFRDVLELISGTHEYSEVPVRHNEDQLNAELADLLPWSPFGTRLAWPADSPYAKAFLLLEGHCLRMPAPIKDYANDTKSVLDQSMRILNALVEVAVHRGDLTVALAAMGLSQCIVQGRFWNDHPFAQLRRFPQAAIVRLREEAAKADEAALAARTGCLLPLLADSQAAAAELRKLGAKKAEVAALAKELQRLPQVKMNVSSTAGEVRVSLATANSKGGGRQVPFGRYSKAKDYSWWVVVAAGDRLLHCKHFMGLPANFNATFAGQADGPAPTRVLLVSGSVMGVDQDHSIV